MIYKENCSIDETNLYKSDNSSMSRGEQKPYTLLEDDSDGPETDNDSVDSDKENEWDDTQEISLGELTDSQLCAKQDRAGPFWRSRKQQETCDKPEEQNTGRCLLPIGKGVQCVIHGRSTC